MDIELLKLKGFRKAKFTEEWLKQSSYDRKNKKLVWAKEIINPDLMLVYKEGNKNSYTYGKNFVEFI